MTKQAGQFSLTTTGTYRIAPSHVFEGREAIFQKGHPTTAATATKSYLKQTISPGTKWTLTKNRSNNSSTMDEGKGARKSDFITETPTRNEQPSKRAQDLPKKPRSAIKKDLIAFFGDGRRTPAPSTEGSPIETVKQRREYSSAGKGDVGTATGEKTVDNNSWRTPIVKKKRDKTRATLQDEENEKEQMTKKPRSDDEEFKVGNTVDLKSMSASLRKKGQPKSQKSKEDSAKKTIKTPRKKATFAPEDSKESGRNKEEEKVVPVSAQCVIGFAIRVDRGNNTKGGFNKKVSEGLTFLREFVDPAACILPNGKDERL